MEENPMLTEILCAIAGAVVTALCTLIINRVTRRKDEKQRQKGAAQLDALLKAQCFQEVQENLAILRTAGTGPFRGTEEGLQRAASVVRALKTGALTTLWENVNKLSGLKSADEEILAATAIRQPLELTLHKISVMKNLLALVEQGVEAPLRPTRRFTNIEKQLKELTDLLRPRETGAANA
ncbi:hypothetical protein FACS189473_1010 [Spirochaetia bacterium]|nr:hypothetical protein FACS189473_1010 [Spirochaetia bacterium]